ncbi:pyridoxal-phosphate dependent enzyme [Aliikangiella marina]|uniref:Pyridoxal-phosphate dependent enzyme n=1 Tax=Aliikangiella marina TaxID=1712262 RepID=A0A545T6Q7_9GAMM|nr:pyridoxal-phosphate dependent enzyme [Aliikangiella marina]TQV72903.1 pyridoxal-phosphate dependent enzyme [Aliikangiella marina]
MRLSKFHHIFAEINAIAPQIVTNAVTIEHDVTLQIKRDDLLHPVVSGNKWRKLKHTLMAIENQGMSKLVAMGGPYSNLLHSLAYLCYRLGWHLKVLIRAYPEQPLTPMLNDIKRWGAEIEFVDRKTFRTLRENPPECADDEFWINEGGFGETALKGTMETLMEFNQLPDYLIMATATGASIAGLAMGCQSLKRSIKVIGISVLNNALQVAKDIQNLLPPEVEQPEIISGFEFGGYAKSSSALDTFIANFEKQTSIPLEKVYSGKSFYATMSLIEQGYFRKGSHIALIHCGGLQGKRE